LTAPTESLTRRWFMQSKSTRRPSVALPIRAVLRKVANARVVLGKVSGVDKERRIVTVDDRQIGYDYLVIATGARHSYFGRDDWESAAPGLKKIDDATGIRRRILTAFEQAEAAQDPDARRRFLTFVVIGGGATGVEMAGVRSSPHQA
jgi:NADH:ubiquinone reductase (H+-translocating)